MKVTLTDDEGHRRKSKVTKIELMVIYRKLLHSQTSYLVPRYNTISNSRSKVRDVEVSAFSECFLFQILFYFDDI